jgi:hypothetical protein
LSSSNDKASSSDESSSTLKSLKTNEQAVKITKNIFETTNSKLSMGIFETVNFGK